MYFYGVFSNFWEVLLLSTTLNYMSNLVYPPKSCVKHIYPLEFYPNSPLGDTLLLHTPLSLIFFTYIPYPMQPPFFIQIEVNS